MSASPSPIHLRFASSPALLEGVRHKCEAFAKAAGLSDHDAGAVGLCVNEAIANVIRHAYGGAHDRPIELDLEAEADGIRIRIRDWGSGVDPSRLPLGPKDPLVPGGLGLICLREMMTVVDYAPQPDGGMLLTLVKRR